MVSEQGRPVPEGEIHPSHETFTGKPYFRVGERVSMFGTEGVIEKVSGKAIRTEAGDVARYEYLVRFDNGEMSNWTSATNLRKL